MDVVVPVLVHMSVVTMVEFCLRFIKSHYSPADFQSQEESARGAASAGNGEMGEKSLGTADLGYSPPLLNFLLTLDTSIPSRLS